MFSAPKLIWWTVSFIGLFVLSVLTPTFLVAPQGITDSRAVFLIDHGTHSSLAIENQSGDMVRYAYGDLRYYATRDTSLGSGAAALFLPTPATLGRGELSGPATKESVEAQLLVVVEVIYRLEVKSERAESLIAELDQLHLLGEQEHIDVPAYGLVFAPHPTSYYFAHNSSTVIAGWLRDLGVIVLGWGLLASWGLLGSN